MESHTTDGRAGEAIVVEATAIEDPPTHSTQLVRRERRSEVLHPLDREQLVASFREYQELCKELLDDSDYQAYTQRERDAQGNWQTVEKRFKKKSAWRKLATAFDLDLQIVLSEVERDPEGDALRASVIARAIAPSGRYQDGDGYCSATEPRFMKDKGREKLENDLRGTATTRAKNRAIADLLGTGEVSAEEMSGDSAGNEQMSQGPTYGRVVPSEIKPNAINAAVRLCDGDLDRAKALWAKIQAGLDGYMPYAAAVALLHASEHAAPAATSPVGDAGGEKAIAQTQPQQQATGQHGAQGPRSNGSEAESEEPRNSPDPEEPETRLAAAPQEAASRFNPHGARVCATANARGVGDAELANLIRNAVGHGPIAADRARTVLPRMLERMSEQIAQRTIELIDMLHPVVEPGFEGEPSDITTVDFGTFEPPPAA